MYQYASYHITALPLPYRGQRYHSFDRYHTGPYRYPSVDHYRRALTLSYNGHKAHSDYIEPRSGQLLPQCYVATLMLPSSMVLQPIPGLLMLSMGLLRLSGPKSQRCTCAFGSIIEKSHTLLERHVRSMPQNKTKRCL